MGRLAASCPEWNSDLQLTFMGPHKAHIWVSVPHYSPAYPRSGYGDMKVFILHKLYFIAVELFVIQIYPSFDGSLWHF